MKINNSEIELLNKKILRLEEDSARLKQQVLRETMKVHILTSHGKKIHNQLINVYKSNSWLTTRPFRTIKDYFKFLISGRSGSKHEIPDWPPSNLGLFTENRALTKSILDQGAPHPGKRELDEMRDELTYWRIQAHHLLGELEHTQRSNTGVNHDPKN